MAAVVMLWGAGANGAEPSPGERIAIANLSHALEDRTLTITGWLENRGATPISQLVIDARGFGPSGDLVALGSDGIPWEVLPGGTERFTIALTVTPKLVRDYLVQVSTRGSPSRQLAKQRQGVSTELYRPLLFSRVEVTAELNAGMLTIHTSAEGLPVNQVTVRATVLLHEFDPLLAHVFSVDLDVPADGTTVITLGTFPARLLSVRIVDLRLKTAWSD